MRFATKLSTAIGLFSLGAGLFALPANPEEAKPNIVLFIMDDHGQRDSSAYGANDLPTPQMERLAKRGTLFTHAFVASPSCAPSRAALLTGLMPARNGAEPNHSKPRAEIKKLPAWLKELGYEVVAFGKVAHYEHGSLYGFDYCGFERFHDHRGISAAIAFLERRISTAPLCLIVGTHWPHVPWPPQDDRHSPPALRLPATHVDTPQTRDWRSRYYAAVTKADDDLGLIHDAAEKRLGKNTLFVCTSDHGAQWPFGKWNLYDEGIRVPFIAAWPGVIPAGGRSAALISWIDILPTFIEVAGGKPPETLDGRSFAAVLRGEKETHRDQIFATHSGDGKMNVYPMRAVRTREWKYIRNLQPLFRYTTHIDKAAPQDGSGYFASWRERAKSDQAAAAIVARYHARPAEELYAVDKDPLEQHNLAADAAYAGRLGELRTRVDKWMTQWGDTGMVFGTPTLLETE